MDQGHGVGVHVALVGAVAREQLLELGVEGRTVIEMPDMRPFVANHIPHAPIVKVGQSLVEPHRSTCRTTPPPGFHAADAHLRRARQAEVVPLAGREHGFDARHEVAPQQVAQAALHLGRRAVQVQVDRGVVSERRMGGLVLDGEQGTAEVDRAGRGSGKVGRAGLVLVDLA